MVSIDCGVVHGGFHGDAAITLPVGEVAPERAKLLASCRAALWAGIAALRPGARLRDVSAAIEGAVGATPARYGIIRDYVGHGIGRTLHEPPQVPNQVTPTLLRDDFVLEPGLVVALEPILCLGTHRTRTRPDGWTVVTRDGEPAAHFEHTVAVTEDGYEVLTLCADGSATH